MPAISGFPLTIGLGTSLLVERGRAPRCKAADGVRVGSVFGKLGRWIGVNRALGFGLLFLLLAIRVIDPVPLAALRYAAFDLYQQVKPREYQPLPVAVIDIDDASLAELGQWPWPRDMLADLIDAARAQGVAGIAFDVLFAEPDRLSPDKLAAGRDLPQTLRAEIAALPSTDDLLAQAFARARERGGACEVIVIDPGIGFGKTAQHNLEIIRRLGELHPLGRPILMGCSRKSFIGAVQGLEVDERLESTLAAHTASVLAGAHIVRVHDVAPHVRAMRMADALLPTEP